MILSCTRKNVDCILERGTVASPEERAILVQYFLNTQGAHQRRIDTMRNGVLRRMIRIAKLLNLNLPEAQIQEEHERAMQEMCMTVGLDNDYSHWKTYPRPPLGKPPDA